MRVRLGLFLTAFCLIDEAMAATQHYTKSWNTVIMQGALSSDKKLRYYLQPEINFIDDKYKIQDVFGFAGIGYQATSAITVWMMGGYSFVKKVNGSVAHRNTIRQQLDWLALTSNNIFISSLSRLEERKDSSQRGWAVRVRERVMVRLPLPHWEHHSLVLFDELFFDLNHPAWINGNTFLEQNRAFVGIGTQFSKHTSLDMGYVNQCVMKNTNSVSHVLYVALNVQLT